MEISPIQLESSLYVCTIREHNSSALMAPVRTWVQLKSYSFKDKLIK